MMVIDVLFLIAKLLRMATPETKAAVLAGKPLEVIKYYLYYNKIIRNLYYYIIINNLII
jgi:hypothetical protein